MKIRLSRRFGVICIATALMVLAMASYYLAPTFWQPGLIAVDRALIGMRENTVAVDGHPVRYIRGGSGPVLILLHGFGGNKEQWHSTAHLLGKQFNVIAPDLPGFGESPAWSADFSISHQADMILSWMDALEIREAHIVGSSMGGHIAAQLASLHPDRVRSLVLIEPHGVKTMEQTDFDRRIASGRIPLLASDHGEFKALADLVFVNMPFLPYPIYAMLEHQAIERKTAYTEIWRQVRVDSDSLPALMTSVRVPTLLLWGDSQRVFHTTAIDILKQNNPNVRTQVFASTGHLVMMEKPAQTAMAIASFVALRHSMSVIGERE